MSQEKQIKQLLEQGLIILNNVDKPTIPEHSTLAYCEKGYIKLREAGILIHSINPELNSMIEYIHKHVALKDHGFINHGFSGIGDWQC